MPDPLLNFPHPGRLSLITILVLLSLLCESHALVNVTIQRANPAISYSPSEEWVNEFPGVMFSDFPGANATLEFTGTAIYYQSWLWSSPTLITAQIDDERVVRVLDLQDHDTTEDSSQDLATVSVTIQIAGGLPDIPHTLVISRMESHRATIVGRLIYSTDFPPGVRLPYPSSSSKTLEPTQSIPSETSVGTSATAGSSSESESDSEVRARLVIIIPAVVGGLLAIALVAGTIIYLARRRTGDESPRTPRELRLKPRNQPPTSGQTWKRVHSRSNSESDSSPSVMNTLLRKIGLRRDRPRSPHQELNLEPHIVILTQLEKDELLGWKIDGD